MPQQIFVIHGGNAFDHYDDYVASLLAKIVTLEQLREVGWKARLGDVLGKDFEVFNPRMPNAQNARYLEWKIYFEKLISLMEPNVILIGHSLGAIFLAKYLSEEVFPKSIKATFLVGAPFNTAEIHPLVDFNVSPNLDRLAQQGGDIVFYHSKDDEVVPYSNLEDYRRCLPNANYVTLYGRGHITDETFPELVAALQKLV